MAQYVRGLCHKRRDASWQYGPFWFMVLAVILVMMDLTRHVIADNFHVDWGMYDKNGWFGLSTIGLFVTVGCTWTGFICLFISILWATNLPAKLYRAWNAIRTDPRAGEH